MHKDLTIQRWLWVALLTIFLLTAYLLIIDLDQTSLWADEGWTIAATSVDSPDKVITEWVAVDVHPPLFFLELWAWRQFTGDTIFEMRMFSVLLVMIGVAVTYRVGREIFKSPWVGVIAAFFFGVHDLVRVLTQEVRHYPQQQLMAALVLWAYWRFFINPNRNRGIAFVLVGAGLLYTHYWGGFVLLGMGLHSLITRWRRFQPFLFAYLGIGGLFALWLPTLYDQITVERPSGLPHALENSWVVYDTIAHQVVGLPEGFWMIMAVVGLIGGLFFAGSEWRSWRPHSGSVLLGLIVILTPLLSILFNEYYNTLSFRSLAVIIPALAALVGYGLTQFRLRERSILLVFIVLQSIFATGADALARPPWPEYSEYIAQHTTEDDLVLFELDTDEYSVEYFINKETDMITYDHTQSDREKNPDEFPEHFDNLLADVDGLWMAKFGWYFYDIRSAIETRGFVQASDPIEWEPYVDNRPVELIRYERIPEDTDPIMTLSERFALHKVDVTRHPEWVTVNLLWEPLEDLDDFYTMSVFLFKGGILTEDSQHDSYPLDGLDPTLGWEAGTYHFDSHTLYTEGLPTGEYAVGIKIYRAIDGDYGNLEILAPSTCVDEACTFAFVDSVVIE